MLVVVAAVVVARESTRYLSCIRNACTSAERASEMAIVQWMEVGAEESFKDVAGRAGF